MTAIHELRLPHRHTIGAAGPARWLHPGAWWLWALGCATAASRTTNPVLLVLLVLAAGVVVRARRPNAPWARSFTLFLLLGAAVIVIRTVTQMVFGTGASGPLLFTLPQIGLPDYLAGVSLGGPVYLGDLLYGLIDGLRLAALLICMGAATALASPSRMLKTVPAALYELGVAVVVALTFTPQLVGDILRVRGAQRLRGRSTAGLRGWWSAVVPVVNGSLERSVQLAAAMDARGYGRQAAVPVHVRRGTQALLLLGMAGVLLGLYGTLSGGEAGDLGPPIAVAGVALAVAGLALAGRRQVRTRYRPDPWGLPEWLVSGSGALTATVFIAVAAQPGSPANWQAWTGGLPPVPPLLVAACLLAMLPAAVAPQVPEAVRR